MWGKVGYIGALAIYLGVFALLIYVKWPRPQPVCTIDCPGMRSPGPVGGYKFLAGDWYDVYQTQTEPSARYEASLAYDGAHRQWVLFGGETNTGPSDETWTFDEISGWVQRHPMHHPSARRDAAMTWDPTLRADLLYGGLAPRQVGPAQMSDTWVWGGEDWSNVRTGTSGPGPRDGPRMVFTDDGVLLFGGHVDNETYFGDAWAFNGSQWTRVDHDPTPPGRGDAAVVWDPLDRSLFVYGGSGKNDAGGAEATGAPLGDGWLMRDGAWRRIDSAGPPPVTLANAFWSPVERRVIVIDGLTCSAVVDDRFIWQWGPSGWLRTPELARGWPGPDTVWGSAAAESPDGAMLVVGGSDRPECPEAGPRS